MSYRDFERKCREMKKRSKFIEKVKNLVGYLIFLGTTTLFTSYFCFLALIVFFTLCWWGVIGD